MLTNNNYINYIIPSILFRKNPLTLFTPVLLYHIRLARSFLSLPMLSLPSLSTDCLSFPPPGGPGPPSPPSPTLTLFPSGPRQQPASMSGTINIMIDEMKKPQDMPQIRWQPASPTSSKCDAWKAHFTPELQNPWMLLSLWPVRLISYRHFFLYTYLDVKIFINMIEKLTWFVWNLGFIH